MNDGGPAFPVPDGVRLDDLQAGMTLRDYFAAQSLTGLLMRKGYSIEETARDAYLMADGMLKAREMK